MKLQANQVSQQLKRQRPQIIWAHGDDAYLRHHVRRTITDTLAAQGHTELTKFTIERQVDIEALWQATQSMSLFGGDTNIIIECTSTPPEGLTKWLSEYLDRPASEVMLAVISTRLTQAQQKTRWFQKVDTLGLHVPLWPPEHRELPSWLQQLAGQHQLKLTPDAAQWLAECTEGNLFSAQQTIEKLSYEHKSSTISVDTLQAQACGDNSHFDVYQWTQTCLAGNLKRAIHILTQLKAEQVEPTLTVWAMSKDIHLLCQLHQINNPSSQQLQRLGIWPKRQPAFTAALRRLSLHKCHDIIRQLAQCDLIIKGLQNGDIWHCLHQMTVDVAR